MSVYVLYLEGARSFHCPFEDGTFLGAFRAPIKRCSPFIPFPPNPCYRPPMSSTPYRHDAARLKTEILAGVEAGAFLKTVCAAPGMPSVLTVRAERGIAKLSSL